MSATTDHGPTSLTPLAEVERAVQARAKDIALDMGTPGRAIGAPRPHRRRARPLGRRRPSRPPHLRAHQPRHRRRAGLAQPRRLRPPHRAARRPRRLGDRDQLARPRSSCKRHTGRSGYHHEVFHDDDHVTRTLTKLLDDSATGHRKLDPSEGLQDAQLDDGSRLHIVHGDLARGGHLMVNIRRSPACRSPASTSSSSAAR